MEFGIRFDNTVAYVPKELAGFIKTKYKKYSSKYATIGNHLFELASLVDGSNEKGLMGTANLLPYYASFAEKYEKEKINIETKEAFSYLLRRCKNIAEVREEAKN